VVLNSSIFDARSDFRMILNFGCRVLALFARVRFLQWLPRRAMIVL
jgi:hypothetical protein